MIQTRKIHRTVKSKPTIEGAGVHLQRAFGGATDARTFDPFLLLDDFRNDAPSDYSAGFPWHPHRGIETITYMLRGKVEHGDSMGNQGAISAGDVQWMTAGSGILHQEMPKGDPDGRMYGFQLWANLPRADKMMSPRYQDVKSAQIPSVTMENGVGVRVLCGEAAGARGPVENIVIDPQYLDISVPAKTRLPFPTAPGYTVLAYVIDGKATFCEEQDAFAYEREGSNYFDMQHDRQMGDRTLIHFEEGGQIVVTTEEDPVRFLLISGRPIHEPIAWYGPIVMNTEGELRQAFEELEQGTFIKARLDRRKGEVFMMERVDPGNKAQIVYFSHGGGPLPILGDASHKAMVEFMRKLPDRLRKPEAILVISAHWEESAATLLGAQAPEMFYDYYGFPEQAYEITYPAPGSPELAKRIAGLIRDHDIPAAIDPERGFDHGLFIPLKLMYPQADIPSIQLSLLRGLNPGAHIALGKALRALMHENILVIGSGFSFHNLRAFAWEGNGGTDPANEAFQDWLIETCTGAMTQAEREKRLVEWEKAPSARYCHPREEHLLPLHVCQGMANKPGEVIFDDQILGKRGVAFLW